MKTLDESIVTAMELPDVALIKYLSYIFQEYRILSDEIILAMLVIKQK